MSNSYRIKKIRFFSRKVPILCQNENGPCPLLAICNILLLQGNVSIHLDLSEITFSELTQLVAGFLLDANPPHDDLRINVNQQTQLDAVIKLLPRLQYGLDVNVRFNSTRGFEFTEEMAAFDMTGITLLHGWILDPEDRRTTAVMNGMSYNKLVEKLLEFRSLSAELSHSSEQCAGSAADTRQSTNEDIIGRKAPGVAEDATVGESATFEERKSDQLISTGSSGSLFPKDNAPEKCVVPDQPMSSGIGTGIEQGAVRETRTSVVESASPAAQKSSLTSDQRLETLIEAKCEATATALKEGQVAEDFFRDTASQLTYYGLSRLHQEVRERQLCVFFRNNHFSSMFKCGGKLYLLITDFGYARESSVVWEKLDQIDGDSEYVDSDFNRSSRCGLANAGIPTQLMEQHDDEDLMLALALQQEASSSLAPSACVVSGERPGANDPSDVAWGDEAVALALYNEERARFEQQRREPEALSPPLPAEHADRRPLLHWDRRRQAEVSRGQRSESGAGCLIQ